MYTIIHFAVVYIRTKRNKKTFIKYYNTYIYIQIRDFSNLNYQICIILLWSTIENNMLYTL